MSVTHVVDAWITFAAIATIAWVLWVAWPRLVVDVIRQRLFEVRDELFVRAMKGELEFGSGSYQAARTVLNSMIRNAEHATAWRYARLASLMRGEEGEKLVARFREALTGSETPQAVRDAYRKAGDLYDQLLIFRSPFLAAVALIVLILAKLLRRVAGPLQAEYWGVASYLRKKRSDAVSADVSADLRIKSVDLALV